MVYVWKNIHSHEVSIISSKITSRKAKIVIHNEGFVPIKFVSFGVNLREVFVKPSEGQIEAKSSIKTTVKRISKDSEVAVYFVQFFQVIGLEFQVSKIKFRWNGDLTEKVMEKIQFNGMVYCNLSEVYNAPGNESGNTSAQQVNSEEIIQVRQFPSEVGRSLVGNPNVYSPTVSDEEALISENRSSGNALVLQVNSEEIIQVRQFPSEVGRSLVGNPNVYSPTVSDEEALISENRSSGNALVLQVNSEEIIQVRQFPSEVGRSLVGNPNVYSPTVSDEEALISENRSSGNALVLQISDPDAHESALSDNTSGNDPSRISGDESDSSSSSGSSSWEIVPDLTAPSRPNGPLKVSNVTAEGCKLKWTKPEDDGGKPITGYSVEKLDTSTEDWVPVGQTHVPEMDMTGFTPGREYRFRVMAINIVGESEPLETDIATLAKNPINIEDLIYRCTACLITQLEDASTVMWGSVCGHTVCGSCKNKIVRRNGTRRCPLCSRRLFWRNFKKILF